MSKLPERIPPSVFKKFVTLTTGEKKFVDVSTEDLFENKRVVIFGLPGAFTPTCSGQQLPGFEQLYHEYRQAGIDDIYCISVNDSFVMNEWGMNQGLVNVKLIPDGSAEFTIKMGMDVRKDNLGFGIRSWRYAAIVDNHEVIQSFVEEGFNDNIQEDPYEVSTPENVLLHVKSYDWPAVEVPVVTNELETFGDIDVALKETAVLSDEYDSVGKNIELEISDSTSVKEKIR